MLTQLRWVGVVVGRPSVVLALGRRPGDIVWGRGNAPVYIQIVTSLVVGIAPGLVLVIARALWRQVGDGWLDDLRADPIDFERALPYHASSHPSHGQPSSLRP